VIITIYGHGSPIQGALTGCLSFTPLGRGIRLHADAPCVRRLSGVANGETVRHTHACVRDTPPARYNTNLTSSKSRSQGINQRPKSRHVHTKDSRLSLIRFGLVIDSLLGRPLFFLHHPSTTSLPPPRSSPSNALYGRCVLDLLPQKNHVLLLNLSHEEQDEEPKQLSIRTGCWL